MNAATKKDVRHWLLVFLAILAVVIPLAAAIIGFTYYAEAHYSPGPYRWLATRAKVVGLNFPAWGSNPGSMTLDANPLREIVCRPVATASRRRLSCLAVMWATQAGVAC